MTDKELQKLSRIDLLELLLEKSKENEKLQEELEQVKAKLAEREIKIEKAGSIAEAAIAETLKNIKTTSANVNKVLLGIFVITLAWVFTTFLMTAQGVSSAVQ